MITAIQTTALPEMIPERLVRFGRLRRSLSIAVVEDDRGTRVEARVGRRLVHRIDLGSADAPGYRERLTEAVAKTARAAAVELLRS